MLHYIFIFKHKQSRFLSAGPVQYLWRKGDDLRYTCTVNAFVGAKRDRGTERMPGWVIIKDRRADHAIAAGVECILGV